MPFYSSGERVGADVPNHTYYAHEDIIAVHTGDPTTSVMSRTAESLAQLQKDGYAEHFQGVPFTDDDQVARGENGTYREIARQMAFDAASNEAGLRAIDTRHLDDAARAELDRIGFSTSDLGGDSLLSSHARSGAEYTVSEGRRVNPSDDEAIQRRAQDIGSFAHVNIPLGHGNSIPSIAYTDQGGNQAIAPRSETLDQLLDTLGYREVEQPTFDINILDKEHPAYPTFGDRRLDDFIYANTGNIVRNA